MSSDRACVSGAMLRVQAVTAARESLGRVNGAAVGADKRIVRILISLTPVHVANAFFFFFFSWIVPGDYSSVYQGRCICPLCIIQPSRTGSAGML